MSTPRRGAGGFTLIELMVTIAIVAILATIAVPSFKEFARDSQLTSVTNSLLSALQTARAEAMKRNRNVLVAPIDASSWRNGWQIFVDANFDNAYAAADGDTLLSRSVSTDQSNEIPSYLDITLTTQGSLTQPFVIFDGSGFARLRDSSFGWATLQLWRNDDPTNYRKKRLIKIHTARIRTCTPRSSTDPLCIVNDE